MIFSVVFLWCFVPQLWCFVGGTSLPEKSHFLRWHVTHGSWEDCESVGLGWSRINSHQGGAPQKIEWILSIFLTSFGIFWWISFFWRRENAWISVGMKWGMIATRFSLDRCLTPKGTSGIYSMWFSKQWRWERPTFVKNWWRQVAMSLSYWDTECDHRLHWAYGKEQHVTAMPHSVDLQHVLWL